MSLVPGNIACGVFSADTSQTSVLPSGPVKPYAPVDNAAILAEMSKRLQNLESAIKLTVSSDRVLSAIVLTKDAALISADKIAVVGETNFFDWQRDISGQSTGVIDPSVTQIRGGVIRTEKVISFDGQSWLDLDATGTTPFVRCRDTVSIRANGTFTFGNTSGKQLIWDGSNLSVASSVLINGMTASTLTTYAGDVPNKLAKAGTDVLSGQISFTSSGAFTVGTPTIDGSGNVTGGTGLAFTQKGIVGISSGVTTFAISTTGSAVFKGDITGASGTFSGNLSTSGYVYSTGSIYDPVYGLNGSIIGVKTGSGINGVLGINKVGVGGQAVFGESSTVTGIGVYGNNSGTFGAGVYGASSGGATSYGGWFSSADIALKVDGKMTINNSTLVSNLYAQYAKSANTVYSVDFSSHYFNLSNSQPLTGSGIATSILTNKPGGNSSNSWLSIMVDGIPLYVQIWT